MTSTQGDLPGADAPGMQLGAATYHSGEAIAIKFAAPVSSTQGHRAWVAIADPGSAPSAYDTWDWVADRATSATLKAPEKPGAYEVRLHTDYPTKAFNVRRTLKLSIVAAAPASVQTPRDHQRFALRATTVHAGDSAELVFPEAMHAAHGERFWVTTVEKGAADTTWGKYEYVPEGARTMKLVLPTHPGDYEVRLHANYPTLTTNVVFRAAIHIDQLPAPGVTQ